MKYRTAAAKNVAMVPPIAIGRYVRRPPGGMRASLSQVTARPIGRTTRISIAQPRFHQSSESGGFPT
jgi:hypothetical protein